MDALTSMSTVTGYKAVLMAANEFPSSSPYRHGHWSHQAAKFLVIGLAWWACSVATANAWRLHYGGGYRDEARKAGKSLGAKIVGFESRPSWHRRGRLCQSPAANGSRKERQEIGPHVEAADNRDPQRAGPRRSGPVLSPRKSSSA